MTKRSSGKLNYLNRSLPQGLVVDAAWMSELGYSTSLRSQYVSAGWLVQPARRVYRRPSGALTWQHVVISLQALLGHDLAVGGRTALELKGFAHYLPQTQREVHLYGPKPPPKWVHDLPIDARFRYHNSVPLFGDEPELEGIGNLKTNGPDKASAARGLSVVDLGGPEAWPLTVSTPERAILELLDELPSHESFHHADMLMEGLTSLSPRRLQMLLERCSSVKAKRLFLFFANRHNHRWFKALDRSKIDLGRGKRVLARGGKLDKTYQITLPADLHAVQ